MVTPESVILWIHIAAGGLALLAGAGALLTTKGGLRHRRAGRIYVGSMGVVVGTVFPLFAIDPTRTRTFLALVAILSGYFAFSGYRVLSRKRPDDRGGAIDWVAGFLVIGACFALGGWGFTRVLAGERFGVVMVLLGTFGGSAGLSDLWTFHTGEQGGWIGDHLGRMIGAYIATVTAVSAVNLTMVPRVVAWLWPSVVGVPLIWYCLWTYADTGPFARLAR